VKRGRVAASFTGGDIRSNGCVLLLREVDRRVGLMRKVAAQDEVLGSASNLLCRLENWPHHQPDLWDIHAVIPERFIASFATLPEELIL
jgi:hypothetical protein